MIGNILATSVRILNAPLRATEKFIDPESQRDDETNVLSAPLESLAEALEEADE
jgi:hypothetical protein